MGLSSYNTHIMLMAKGLLLLCACSCSGNDSSSESSAQTSKFIVGYYLDMALAFACNFFEAFKEGKVY